MPVGAWLRHVVVLPLFVCPVAWAEPTHPAVAAGDRIRYKAPPSRERWTVAHVLESDGWSLLVRPLPGGDPAWISPALVERLEMSRGRRARAREGALIGFVPGAIMGAMAFALACLDYEGPGDCTGRAMSWGAVIGGSATAGLGALVGLGFKSERWEPVAAARPRIGLNLIGGHGLGAAVSIRF